MILLMIDNLTESIERLGDFLDIILSLSENIRKSMFKRYGHRNGYNEILFLNRNLNKANESYIEMRENYFIEENTNDGRHP